MAPPRAKTLGEILRTSRRKLHHGQQWGCWKLDAARLVLFCTAPYTGNYELDLERVFDAASLLDWLYQIFGKGWCAPEVIASLLDALDAIFHPQRHLCSFGLNSTIDPQKFLAARIQPPTEVEREESYRQARQFYEAWGIPIIETVEGGHDQD